MKITKSQLKQIIKEELATISEAGDPERAAELAAGTRVHDYVGGEQVGHAPPSWSKLQAAEGTKHGLDPVTHQKLLEDIIMELKKLNVAMRNQQ